MKLKGEKNNGLNKKAGVTPKKAMQKFEKNSNRQTPLTVNFRLLIYHKIK